jgi:pimeloyl-ACP methyl ester carboxylesterase
LEVEAMKAQVLSAGLLLGASIVAAADTTCPTVFDSARHKATDAYKHSFSYQEPFRDYLAAMRNLIQAHNPRAGTTLDGSRTVLDAISPFELQPAAGCPARAIRKGMLLIHGLTDTPYLLHELGEHFAQRCFLVRSILLPGHGTVPGDLINVDYTEWVSATRYGVQELGEAADEIYLVGFSTGGALALDYARCSRATPLARC